MIKRPFFRMNGLSFRKPRRGGRRRAGRPSWRVVADWAVVLAVFCAAGMLAVRLDRLGAQANHGAAVVIDGDTLSIAGERIRLRGIDAFERGQTCRRDGAGYDCGKAAAAALAGLVGGREVSCTGGGRDRYGRLLAVCEAGGRELNAAMVASGWALAYGAYHIEEFRARAAGAGAWAGTFDSPAAWRGTHGRPLESPHDMLRRFLALVSSLLWAQDGRNGSEQGDRDEAL